MVLTATFPPSEHFLEIWDAIKSHEELFIGAQGVDYLLRYTGGDYDEAIALTKVLMKVPGCRIRIIV